MCPVFEFHLHVSHTRFYALVFRPVRACVRSCVSSRVSDAGLLGAALVYMIQLCELFQWDVKQSAEVCTLPLCSWGIATFALDACQERRNKRFRQKCFGLPDVAGHRRPQTRVCFVYTLYLIPYFVQRLLLR